jgi:hypothetical protein
MELNPSYSAGFDEDDDANPCGLVAKTIFNDTFTLTDSGGSVVKIDDDDLTWSFDRDIRFNDHDDKQWVDVENERFIIWMRVSGLLNFRKLWGRIDKDLDEGKYTLTVNSNWDISDQDGEKWFVLSTTNAFGGVHTTMAYYYIGCGTFCVLMALIFACIGLIGKVRVAPNSSSQLPAINSKVE